MKKKINKIMNILEILIIIFIAWGLININPKIVDKNLLSYEKMIDLQLVLLGTMTAVIAFIYSIVRGVQDRYNDKQKEAKIIREQLPKVLKAIDLDIKRVMGSLIVTIVLYMIIDMDIPFIKESIYLSKVEFSTIVKLSTLIYIICAFTDMILSVLKLYHLDID